MNYRRIYQAGGTYFFTVVSDQRRPILIDDAVRNALRDAIITVRAKYPFEIIAWVLMPDHLHTIWRLPEKDANYSLRWREIKRYTTHACPSFPKIWQNRFWEHTVRDEHDFIQCFDYLHFNPIKHGLCTDLSQWAFSTFHRYVKEGLYPADWCEGVKDFSLPYDNE